MTKFEMKHPTTKQVVTVNTLLSARALMLEGFRRVEASVTTKAEAKK